MSLDQFINVLVMVTLVEMMVAIGLGVTLADLVAVARNGPLLLRAALANYVWVPLATVGLLLLFNPHPMVAVGFLILAVCPGAPFGPPLAAIAKGDVSVAVGLMAVLAGSSAVLAPVLLRPLLGLLSADEPLAIDSTEIAGTLLITQLIPLSIGIALRQWRPAIALGLQRPANLLSTMLNLSALALIVISQFQTLLDIRLRGLVGMTAALLASWAGGWLLGSRDPQPRKVMTLTTSLRNVGVGLVIANKTFADSPAVTAVLAYGLYGVLASLLLAVGWGRWASAPKGVASGTTAPEPASAPMGAPLLNS
jgi:bile acid:Na+ symporter, BASS family